MGTYAITETLNDVVGKFTCLVSFNGGAPERYEVDSIEAAVVDETLQKVADDAQVFVDTKLVHETEVAEIKIVDGKIS